MLERESIDAPFLKEILVEERPEVQRRDKNRAEHVSKDSSSDRPLKRGIGRAHV